MKKFLALVAVAVLVAFAAPAFAANPFMDVPMNHWAYDAIGQLASQGVVSGYPDGTFKGNQPMTRYEMASIVARALAVVDMDKASKQDVEMLKKLVVEFKDELDALGVQVDELDGRVAVLEENIGGWKFWGDVRMDAKWADNNLTYGDNYALDGDAEFDLNRYRLWFKKTVNDDLYFVGRIGSSAGTFQRWYAGFTAPYGFEVLVGKFNFDWECDHGMVGPYMDDDFFCDRTVTGFYASKEFGMGDMAFVVSHSESDLITIDDNTGVVTIDPGAADAYLYGAKVNFNFNEQFRFALNGLLTDSDLEGADTNIYWADFTFEFTPGVAFKGEYFLQDNEVALGSDGDDSPNAYRAILEVGQDVFGFSSLWAEFTSLDDGFMMQNSFAYDPWCSASLLALRENYEETDILYIVAEQQWNDKWGTFIRYAKAEVTGEEDTTDYTGGVVFRYMPGVTFTLAYDDVDYGVEGDDNMISLRTFINF